MQSRKYQKYLSKIQKMVGGVRYSELDDDFKRAVENHLDNNNIRREWQEDAFNEFKERFDTQNPKLTKQEYKDKVIDFFANTLWLPMTTPSTIVSTTASQPITTTTTTTTRQQVKPKHYIVVMRHGERDDKVNPINDMERANPDLTKAQYDRYGNIINNLINIVDFFKTHEINYDVRIITSPFKRTRGTANLIKEYLDEYYEYADKFFNPNLDPNGVAVDSMLFEKMTPKILFGRDHRDTFFTESEIDVLYQIKDECDPDKKNLPINTYREGDYQYVDRIGDIYTKYANISKEDVNNTVTFLITHGDAIRAVHKLTNGNRGRIVTGTEFSSYLIIDTDTNNLVTFFGVDDMVDIQAQQ